MLSLNDIRDGLTFEEIAEMGNEEANVLADRMEAVFEFRESWQSNQLG